MDIVGIVWIVLYGVLIVLVVGFMIIFMVICIFILGSILKNGKFYVNEEVEEEFMFMCKVFVRNYRDNFDLKLFFL